MSLHLLFREVWVKLGTVELLNMQVRHKVYWKFTFWVRFCVSPSAVLENVFIIIVFANSMMMHFQNNFYMLFMTIPNVKKMFYILCVHRLTSTSFLCFKMTLGLKRIFLNHCLHYTTKSPHSIFVQSAFLRKKHEINCSQCGAWGSQMAFMYVYLVSWAMEYSKYIWSSEKLWGSQL